MSFFRQHLRYEQLDGLSVVYSFGRWMMPPTSSPGAIVRSSRVQTFRPGVQLEPLFWAYSSVSLRMLAYMFLPLRAGKPYPAEPCYDLKQLLRE